MKALIIEQLITYVKYLDETTEDMALKTAALKGYIDCLWYNDDISDNAYHILISGLV